METHATGQWPAEGIPDLRLEVVPGTAHMTPMERPEAWSAAMLRLWS